MTARERYGEAAIARSFIERRVVVDDPFGEVDQPEHLDVFGKQSARIPRIELQREDPSVTRTRSCENTGSAVRAWAERPKAC